MRKMGLEPTRPCGHKILSLARLPIPTLPHLSLLSRDRIIVTNERVNVKEKFKFFVGFFVEKMSCPSPLLFVISYYKVSISRIHTFTDASLGMRRSPRGDSAIVPTFGPSGMHDRLNCWEKKRL